MSKNEYTYQGTRVPSWIPVPLAEGWEDAGGFRVMEQLYRSPRWKRALYAVGWKLGRLAGRRP